MLRTALALWRGPALADLAGEEFTQGEIRRLEELRLDALEERIAADIELGLHREVIGELEALAAVAPLRERVCALRMLALYRSGRQAEALQAFRDTRAAFVDQLGIEPGTELQELHARILRQEAGLAAPRNGQPTGEVESEILRAVLGGRVVPVLGLVDGAELAHRLAETFDVPGDLSRPARPGHPVRGGDAGPRAAPRRAPRRLRGRRGSRARSIACSRGSRRCCASAAMPYQLIVTTAFDAGIERAFADAGEELDVVTYIAAGPLRGTIRPLPARCRAPGGRDPECLRRSLAGAPDGAAAPSRDRRPGPRARLGEPRRHRGRPHRLSRARASSRARFPSRSPPGCAAATCSSSATTSPTGTCGSSSTGCAAGRAAPYASWAVRAAPTALELAFWRHLDVRAVEVDENAFAGLLDGLLDGIAVP